MALCDKARQGFHTGRELVRQDSDPGIPGNVRQDLKWQGHDVRTSLRLGDSLPTLHYILTLSLLLHLIIKFLYPEHQNLLKLPNSSEDSWVQHPSSYWLIHFSYFQRTLLKSSRRPTCHISKEFNENLGNISKPASRKTWIKIRKRIVHTPPVLKKVVQILNHWCYVALNL